MTVRPINPVELLDLADELVGATAGPGRPKSARLRRGVSTAYYGLFHELTWQATQELLREGSVTPAREALVGRWVSHRDLLELAKAASGGGRAALQEFLRPVSTDVTFIAGAFTDLQAQRHLADYDNTYDVTRTSALTSVLTARSAFERSRSLVEAGDPSYRLFLRLMIGAVQVAKSR